MAPTPKIWILQSSNSTCPNFHTKECAFLCILFQLLRVLNSFYSDYEEVFTLVTKSRDYLPTPLQP